MNIISRNISSSGKCSISGHRPVSKLQAIRSSNGKSEALTDASHDGKSAYIGNPPGKPTGSDCADIITSSVEKECCNRYADTNWQNIT